MHQSILMIAGSAVLGVLVTASAAPPRTIEAPQTRPAATQAVVTGSVDLGERLKQTARQNPSNVEAQLNDQLYRYLAEDPTVGGDELARLEPCDRELVSAITQGLTKFRAVNRGGNDPTLGEKIQPMLEMADALRERANLSVNHLTLCESVERFGVYEPLGKRAIVAGKETAAIVYFEVENFHSRQNAAEVWETNLKYELSVFGEGRPGVAVFSKAAMPVIDKSRTRRRDFFLADRITLPRKLAAGKYVVKVTVTDEQAKRIGEGTVSVEIGE